MKPKPAVDKDVQDRAREKLIKALKVEDVQEEKETTKGILHKNDKIFKSKLHTISLAAGLRPRQL